MQTRTYPIDWRDEFNQLMPYLNGRGGVVRVHYVGERCAPHPFIQTLTSEYERERDNSIWTSVRFDRQVYNVRYLAGIQSVFVRKMRLDLSEPNNIGQTATSVIIGTDIHAGGDVKLDIEDVNVHNRFGGDNAAASSRNRGHWIGELCEQLETFLQHNHMMVIVNHGSRDDQDEFWRHLWCGGLENLIDKGLLLVHMRDTSDHDSDLHDLAPTPHTTVNLPSALGPSAQSHAIDDVAGIISQEVTGFGKFEALVRADTLVRSHVDDIARLHGQFSALLLQWSRSTD